LIISATIKVRKCLCNVFAKLYKYVRNDFATLSRCFRIRNVFDPPNPTYFSASALHRFQTIIFSYAADLELNGQLGNFVMSPEFYKFMGASKAKYKSLHTFDEPVSET
jgi:hypothetical protein